MCGGVFGCVCVCMYQAGYIRAPARAARRDKSSGGRGGSACFSRPTVQGPRVTEGAVLLSYSKGGGAGPWRRTHKYAGQRRKGEAPEQGRIVLKTSFQFPAKEKMGARGKCCCEEGTGGSIASTAHVRARAHTHAACAAAQRRARAPREDRMMKKKGGER